MWEKMMKEDGKRKEDNYSPLITNLFQQPFSPFKALDFLTFSNQEFHYKTNSSSPYPSLFLGQLTLFLLLNQEELSSLWGLWDLPITSIYRISYSKKLL